MNDFNIEKRIETNEIKIFSDMKNIKKFLLSFFEETIEDKLLNDFNIEKRIEINETKAF